MVLNLEICEIDQKEGFIRLSANKLKKGKNTIAISYKNQYNNDGNGCASFIDVD